MSSAFNTNQTCLLEIDIDITEWMYDLLADLADGGQCPLSFTHLLIHPGCVLCPLSYIIYTKHLSK